MERKRILIMTVLVFTIQACYCEESFDINIANSQKEFNKSETVDPHLKKTSTDDKNLTKRDSFYNENNEGNSNFDYQDNKFSDFDGKKNIFVEKETEKKFDIHEGSKWDEVNKMSSSYGGGMDGSRDFVGGNRQNSNSNNNNNSGRNDWDNSNNFFDTGRQPQMNEERQFQYQAIPFPANMEMNGNDDRGFNNNQRSFPNNNYLNNNFYQNNQRDFRNHREQDFNAEKEKTTRIRARYEIPSSNYFSSGKNFNGMENLNFQKPDKAIIINLRTECPLVSPARSHVMHKFLLPPKLHYYPHHPSSSQLYANNQLFSSNAASPNLYYI